MTPEQRDIFRKLKADLKQVGESIEAAEGVIAEQNAWKEAVLNAVDELAPGTKVKILDRLQQLRDQKDGGDAQQL